MYRKPSKRQNTNSCKISNDRQGTGRANVRARPRDVTATSQLPVRRMLGVTTQSRPRGAAPSPSAARNKFVRWSRKSAVLGHQSTGRIQHHFLGDAIAECIPRAPSERWRSGQFIPSWWEGARAASHWWKGARAASHCRQPCHDCEKDAQHHRERCLWCVRRRCDGLCTFPLLVYFF